MSRWTRLRAALRGEKREVHEALAELEGRANSVLDRRERELGATPAEKFAMEQDRARSVDDRLEVIRRQIQDGNRD